MTLYSEDKKRLQAIMEAIDPKELVRLIHAYYADADRADRTSRSQMYLHMGMLSGTILTLLDRQK